MRHPEDSVAGDGNMTHSHVLNNIGIPMLQPMARGELGSPFVSSSDGGGGCASCGRYAQHKAQWDMDFRRLGQALALAEASLGQQERLARSAQCAVYDLRSRHTRQLLELDTTHARQVTSAARRLGAYSKEAALLRSEAQIARRREAVATALLKQRDEAVRQGGMVVAAGGGGAAAMVPVPAAGSGGASSPSRVGAADAEGFVPRSKLDDVRMVLAERTAQVAVLTDTIEALQQHHTSIDVGGGANGEEGGAGGGRGDASMHHAHNDPSLSNIATPLPGEREAPPRAGYTDADAVIHKLRQRVVALTAQLSNALAMEMGGKRRVARLEGMVEEAERRSLDLEKADDDHRSRLHDAAARAAASENAANRMREETSQLRRELGGTQRRLQELEQEGRRLRGHVQTAESDRAVVEEQLRDTKDRHLRQLRGEREQAASESRTIREENGSLCAQLALMARECGLSPWDPLRQTELGSANNEAQGSDATGASANGGNGGEGGEGGDGGDGRGGGMGESEGARTLPVAGKIWGKDAEVQLSVHRQFLLGRLGKMVQTLCNAGDANRRVDRRQGNSGLETAAAVHTTASSRTGKSGKAGGRRSRRGGGSGKGGEIKETNRESKGGGGGAANASFAVSDAGDMGGGGGDNKEELDALRDASDARLVEEAKAGAAELVESIVLRTEQALLTVWSYCHASRLSEANVEARLATAERDLEETLTSRRVDQSVWQHSRSVEELQRIGEETRGETAPALMTRRMTDLEAQLDDMEGKATTWEAKYRRAELDRQAVRLSLRRAQAAGATGAEAVGRRGGRGGRRGYGNAHDDDDGEGSDSSESFTPYGFDDEAREDLKSWLERLMVKCLGASSQPGGGDHAAHQQSDAEIVNADGTYVVEEGGRRRKKEEEGGMNTVLDGTYVDAARVADMGRELCAQRLAQHGLMDRLSEAQDDAVTLRRQLAVAQSAVVRVRDDFETVRREMGSWSLEGVMLAGEGAGTRGRKGGGSGAGGGGSGRSSSKSPRGKNRARFVGEKEGSGGGSSSSSSSSSKSPSSRSRSASPKRHHLSASYPGESEGSPEERRGMALVSVQALRVELGAARVQLREMETETVRVRQKNEEHQEVISEMARWKAGMLEVEEERRRDTEDAVHVARKELLDAHAGESGRLRGTLLAERVKSERDAEALKMRVLHAQAQAVQPFASTGQRANYTYATLNPPGTGGRGGRGGGRGRGASGSPIAAESLGALSKRIVSGVGGDANASGHTADAISGGGGGSGGSGGGSGGGGVTYGGIMYDMSGYSGSGGGGAALRGGGDTDNELFFLRDENERLLAVVALRDADAETLSETLAIREEVLTRIEGTIREMARGDPSVAPSQLAKDLIASRIAQSESARRLRLGARAELDLRAGIDRRDRRVDDLKTELKRLRDGQLPVLAPLHFAEPGGPALDDILNDDVLSNDGGDNGGTGAGHGGGADNEGGGGGGGLVNAAWVRDLRGKVATQRARLLIVEREMAQLVSDGYTPPVSTTSGGHTRLDVDVRSLYRDVELSAAREKAVRGELLRVASSELSLKRELDEINAGRGTAEGNNGTSSSSTATRGRRSKRGRRRGRGGSAGANTSAGSGRNRSLSSRAGAGGHGGVGQEEVSQALHGEYSVFPGTGGNDGDSRMFGDNLMGGVMPMDEMERDQLVASYMVSTKEAQAERDSLAEQLRSVLVQLHTLQDLQDQHAGGGGGNRGDREGEVGYGEQGGQHGQYGGPRHSGSREEGVGGGGPRDAKDDEIRRLRTQLATAEDGLVAAQRMTVTSLADDMEASMRGDADTVDTASSSSSRGRRRGRGGLSRSPGGTRRRGASSTSVSPRRGRTGLAGSSSSSSSNSTSGPSYARNTATSMRRRRGSASSTDTHLQLGEDEQGREREREMRRLEQDLAEARLRLVASSDEADRLRNDFHNARAEADAAESARAEAAAMLSDAAAANEAKAATAAEVDPAGPSDKTPLSGDERRRYSEQVSLLQSRVGAVEAANAQLKAKLILTPHRGTRGGARGSGGGGNISSLSSLNASAAGDGSAAATLRRELAGVRQRLVVAEESLEEARGRAEEAEAVAKTEVDAAHDTLHYEREALGRLRASSQQAQVALQNAQAMAGAQKGVTDELRAQLETMVATNKELAGRTHEHAQQTTEAVSSLRKEVLDGTAEVEALLLRESELEETIVALRAQVAHHEQMEAQLFERLTTIKDKPALPDTARAAAHEVVRLETLLSGKERTLAKMTATVEHLKDRLSAETKRHGDEHGKVQQSLDDLEALKERLRGDTSSAAELAVLRSDKNRLDLKVSELESKHRALQSNIDQRHEQHSGEVARWEARVSESIQENTRLRSRADVLEIRLRTAQAMSGSGSGSGSNAGGGNGAAADMTAHNERNDRTDRAGRGARGGSDASREANREAEEEEERQRRREERDLQDAQMEELRSSMDRLERALGEARLLSDAKGRRVEELVQRSDASEGRASRAEGRVREMQDALDAAREDAGRLRGANDVLRSEVASTKTQMKDASSSAGRIRDMDTTIAGQREGATEHARAAAVRQIAALEESLEATRAVAEASRVECRELRAQLVEVQRQHEEEERARAVERQMKEDREQEREQDRERDREDTRGARRSGVVASASAEHMEEVEEDLNRTRASLAAVQSRADERDEEHAATVRTMEQQVMVLRQQLLAAREALGESRQREEEAHAADAGGNVTAVGGEGRLADMGQASAGDDNTVSGVWATPGPLRGGTGTLGGGAGAGDLTQGGALDGNTSLVATQGTGQAAEVEEGLRRAERRMESLEAELRSAREEGDLLRDRLASKDAELREAAEAAEAAEGSEEGAEAGEKEKAGGKKGGDKAKSGRSSGKAGGKSGKTKGGKRVGGKKGSLVPASSLPHGGSTGEVARLREAIREHSARSSKAEEEAKKLKTKLKAAEADAKSARADRSRKAELLGKAKLDRQQDDDAVQACREELQGAMRRATRAEETSARRETLLCDLRERLARADASVVEERKAADAQRSKEVSEVRTRGDAQKRSSVEGLRRQVEAFKAKVADLEGQKETIQRQGEALKRLKMELQVKNTERMIWANGQISNDTQNVTTCI
jgi:DNA repair exonuclease SbcCD ATPase subunit